MTQDTHTDSPALSTRDSDGTALGTRVVLVADSDPAVTDELATHLRSGFTVRTAYDSADALAALDPDVGVVLLDPDLAGLSARRVLDRATTDTVDCQVAALAAEATSVDGTAFDEILLKPIAPDHLRETVDRLARRSAYRTGLAEYYALAQRFGSLSPDDPEYDRLTAQLVELSDQLDEVFDTLDGDEAYDAALRELDAPK